MGRCRSSPRTSQISHGVVTEAKEATRRAAEVGDKASEAAERRLDQSTSAFIDWAAKHDIEALYSDKTSSTTTALVGD